jgi:L-aminopeptidase/D-esterase-like protein
MVVNAIGDIIEPTTGKILAGPRNPQGKGFLSSSELWKRGIRKQFPPFNTVIGVVATNARFSKTDVNKLARLAGAGIARSVNPCHTVYDGDVLFALSVGEENAEFNAVAIAAAEVVAAAIVRAVEKAETLAGIPAARDIVR